MMKKVLTLVVAVAAMILSSCSSVDCPVQNTVETVYHLYGSNGERITLLDTLTVYTARENRTDSILLNRGQGLSEFNLPISYTSPADTLIFAFNDSDPSTLPVVDTVIVAKTNEPQFESVDCHIAYFHTITNVRWTSNLIDSVAVNKSAVNYDASTSHLHLYLRTE